MGGLLVAVVPRKFGRLVWAMVAVQRRCSQWHLSDRLATLAAVLMNHIVVLDPPQRTAAMGERLLQPLDIHRPPLLRFALVVVAMHVLLAL